MPESIHLFQTKKRLMEWGNWYNYIITMGLGYSNQSLISKLAESGVIIPTTIKLLAPDNEEAEEINALIERMAAKTQQNKPEWAKVIRIHYTEQKKNRKLKIKLSGLPRKIYYDYLQNAEIWLSKQLCIDIS